MRRLLVSVAVLALGQGCAFDDGKPWGRADFSLTAGFDSSSRMQDDGFRTAKDYLIDFEEIAVEFAAVELEVSTSGEVAAFDPANPPPGYSLCHNGHCHAADGALVDYEDIAVEQAGGDSLIAQPIDEFVRLDADTVSLDLSDCGDACLLERGELGLVRLRVSGLRINGTVTDIRDRLTEPVDLDEEFSVDVAIATPVRGTIAADEPGLAAVQLDFRLPPDFLDDVDFAEGAVNAESIQITNALDVDVEMQDL